MIRKLTDAQAAVARVTLGQALRLAGLEWRDWCTSPTSTGRELSSKNLPNVARLARQYGVSVATMSAAVRGVSHSPATRTPRRINKRDWFAALLESSRYLHDVARACPGGVMIPFREWYAFSAACYAGERQGPE